ncbi:lectin like domain-containing protein [Acetobacterium woodii]|uniref:Peptidase C1A papain C-terminal domain-containing protein n=1 Tax=Acetobacterium woodii (strain ATCC 29683 / DSM 1030 / JCM 2381 / KCTC 1655 / WB1) TaxID=931626 RepID=H6LGJ4_ACEWD|nr:lectin like domain-containing protein [Acetobacterium woodii]AFA48322.1 hypothetical protein Awo_c15400 [Acetobacterium woodii DSM 1030]
MKRGFKKVAFLLGVSLIYLSVMSSGIWADELQNTIKPRTAPLNPAYVEYMTDLNNGTIDALTANDDFTGYIPAPLKRFESTESIQSFTIDQSSSFPAVYDLRETGRITSVKNQQPYWCGWAFSSLASLESYLKKDVTTDFSENNMIWNNGFDGEPNDGGNVDMAIAYLTRWSGPVSESDDPFGSAKKTGLLPGYHIQEVNYINSPTAIKQALMDGGALSMAMHSEGFSNDRYYYNPNAAFYYDGNAATDHDVAIVGWDDNFDRNKFVITPPGDGAWILKNSMGTGGGDGGYFYMSYYDTYAGNEVTAFHNAEATDNYSQIYQYDPLGATTAMGYDDNTNSVYGANIFTATAGENLTAISTYALSPKTTCEISIYTDVNAGQPTSGMLKATKTVTIPQAGYYTIKLDNPILLTEGQRFAVVIKYTTPGNTEPVPVEKSFPSYSSAASANAGESFLSVDDTNDWYDVSAEDDVNVCIKAFTNRQEPVVLPNILYRTHVQNLGWQSWKSNGGMSGTTGQSLRLEGIEIKIDSPDYDLGVAYKTHVQNFGWQEWKNDGVTSGTSGQSLRLEAIMIHLSGADANKFDVYYRVHAQNVGWMGWAKNGDKAGTAGFGYRLEGIEIQVVPQGEAAPGPVAGAFMEKR